MGENIMEILKMETLYKYMVVYVTPADNRVHVGFCDDLDLAISAAKRHHEHGCDVYITQTVAHFNAE